MTTPKQPTPALLPQRVPPTPAAAEGKRRHTGYCQACGKRHHLTKAGLMEDHPGYKDDCPGSGTKPRKAMTWAARARYAERLLDQITHATNTRGHLTAAHLDKILAGAWRNEA